MGQFGVGQGLRRLEDARFLTGHGRYTDDIALPGSLHLAVLRSPVAHAELGPIDVEEALGAPGVLAVYTGADLKADGIGSIPCLAMVPGKGGSKPVAPAYPALAQDKVRFVGQPVVCVVAETAAQARDALELVVVDFDPLPAVTEADRALAADAPLVHDAAPGNLCLDYEHGDREAAEQAFAKAARIAKLELINNRLVVNSMEPRVAIADYDKADGRSTLYTCSQGIFRLHSQLAGILGIDMKQLHLVTPDVGGGFGMKIFSYPEQILCLYASRKLQRPVRWTSERTEAFLSDTQGRDHVTSVEMAMDAEGRFLGMRVSTAANLGAYLSNFAPYIPTGASTQMFSGLYKIPAIYANVRCAFTHTVPVDAYRGAGRPEAAYMMERLVDECARVAGLDRREIRKLNFIRPDDLPYETPMGRLYDSGDYPRLLDEATAMADWDGFAARRAEAAKAGKLRGIGLASYVEACGGIGEEEARMTLEADGGINLVIGTMTNGQGHLTAYAQLINDKLGIDPEKVQMLQGDSDIVERGGGTGGSRSLLMGGVAVNRASDKIIERAKQVAAHMLEAAAGDVEFADGTFTIVGTDRRLSLDEVAAATHGDSLPDELKGPIEEKGDYAAEGLTFPNGCHVCELEVDEETGKVRILRYSIADDFGTVVNPLLAAGQVHGGTIQGLGQALLEHTVYDEDGQLLTASYMDYCMPRADDAPEIELKLIQDYPCKTNPLGVKGAGEAGAIGAPPAIMNALADALSGLGVGRLDMPATPEKLWRAIRDGRAGRRDAA
ncbi:carbon-monoxide dehydrogenase large subunit [Tistlia consotensis]|uniref:Carbon-monoxide dehydrogenase large subunit n=1 Tax=Tistlia consotensis USBA 355 TaxID=560819 RepID=A0A1Y6B7P5_9PROT|nr:xanthine dehydrogenase family protein molybdopterin-binding subunit [Tistlia consotensis]SME97376.1 carbon-monoxide dehydrogenase large subunit [Tistlia consotensis USBA 355]SNR56709.1 carbon-monoxide dehydrogenase large subunit [Tistlia consotensis]